MRMGGGILTAVVALLLAGCGSGDSSGGGELSATDRVRRATTVPPSPIKAIEIRPTATSAARPASASARSSSLRGSCT